MAILSRVVPYLWPSDAPGAKVRVVAALAALVMAKVIAVGTPVIYKTAVDALAGEAASPAWALGAGAIALTIAYGVSRILTTGFQQSRDAIFATVGQHALRRVAVQTFRHIHQLSLRYHLGRQTGGLSRVMERGVKGVAFLLRFVVFSIGPLVLELAMVAVVLAVLFDPWYLVVVGGTLIAYIAFTLRVTEWRVGIRREMNRQDQRASQAAIDSLLNFETVKYFGAEGREEARYDIAMEGYAEAAVRTSRTLAWLNIGQSLIITTGLVIVMVMAVRGVQAGAMTVGDFVMVNAYMIQITMPLGMLGSVYREIRQSLVDMGEMFALLDQAPEVADRPGATDLHVTQGHVRFHDVTFGYDAARGILAGVDFDIPPGGQVAIVGATGAGKSTIGRLLFRFYDVGGGAITIDGQDIREVTQDSLHAAIGVVPQDTVLFNDSLFYNIAYGREDATRAQVEAAARAARLHDFAISLPEGYATQVGERGLKLSGGERQRVGIARVLLKDPPIVLLDEATSALDSATEAEIRESLQAMGQGRSVLTIAHRLSTIVEADTIVVLDRGRVTERGDHATLLAQGGLYAGLWARQSGG